VSQSKVEQLNQILKLLRLKDRRSWILMVPNSSGETALICGFAKSFAEKHGFGITLVIRDVHNPIASMYPGRFNAVMNLPFDAMRDFTTYGLIPPNHFDVDFPFNTWPLQYGDRRLYNIFDLMEKPGGRGGLSLTDLYRHVLRLDWDAPIERATLPMEARLQAMKLMTSHDIEPGNSVILFPGNNTNAPAPYAFWTAVTEAYQKKGMQVFTNTAGATFVPGQLPIPGTRALNLGLDTALALSEYAGHMIIGCNGLVILSLLAGIKCRIDSVITDSQCIDPEQGFFPSSQYGSSCQLRFQNWP
jgi:hypothetical protein